MAFRPLSSLSFFGSYRIHGSGHVVGWASPTGTHVSSIEELCSLMDLELWSALPPVHWWAMPTLPCGTLVTGNELDSVTRIEPHASKLAKERERALNPYILYDPCFRGERWI